MSEHIVMFSGGTSSWVTAMRVREATGSAPLLLFADTKMEDEDLYRFIDEASAAAGGRLTTLCDGRDPWQVFRDVRMLGNTRIDPCSKILKRQLIRKWLKANYEPEDVVIYVGFGPSEENRVERAAKFWKPWKVAYPLLDHPWLTHDDMVSLLEEEGIEPPRMYTWGFPHNNCGGFCIKAGAKWFKLLLEVHPERYRYHEQKEQEIREYLGKDVSILRDRRGGSTKPMTLKSLRERIESNQNLPLFGKDLCGGSCFYGSS